MIATYAYIAGEHKSRGKLSARGIRRVSLRYPSVSSSERSSFSWIASRIQALRESPYSSRESISSTVSSSIEMPISVFAMLQHCWPNRLIALEIRDCSLSIRGLRTLYACLSVKYTVWLTIKSIGLIGCSRSMGTVSVHLPDDLEEELDSFLEYGDSRSAFVSEAIRAELDRRKENQTEEQSDD